MKGVVGMTPYELFVRGPGFVIANFGFFSLLMIFIKLKKFYSAITIAMILSIGWWVYYG